MLTSLSSALTLSLAKSTLILRLVLVNARAALGLSIVLEALAEATLSFLLTLVILALSVAAVFTLAVLRVWALLAILVLARIARLRVVLALLLSLRYDGSNPRLRS